MPRKTKKSEPATQEQLDEIQDGYREERVIIGDLYLEARRVGDDTRARELWEFWKVARAHERDELLSALQVQGLKV